MLATLVVIETKVHTVEVAVRVVKAVRVIVVVVQAGVVSMQEQAVLITLAGVRVSESKAEERCLVCCPASLFALFEIVLLVVAVSV